MNTISDTVISVEEARTALRCMRLCNLDEYEALESVDSLVERIRRISMAKLVESIIETKLTENQRTVVQSFWFSEKNTSQIARELGVSQSNVYRTLTRANETIKELLTPLVTYFSDLPDVQVAPVIFRETMKTCSAREGEADTLSAVLTNIRLSKAVAPECAAQAMCITVKELVKIESGKVNPTVDYIRRFSQAFNVELNFSIVNGKGRYEWKEVLQI
ncbi:MAG: transcriptional regulator [Clostridia bacterium]|nr:transcriptional regulator [Clostridia bacterium]